MLLYKNVKDLNKYLDSIRQQGKTIGFAPTMGALHEGHVSLLEYSKTQSDYTVCSIFVNPTQFNESSDLKHYPRTPAKDLALLHSVGCDVVFMPPVSEIYPENVDTEVHFDFQGLDLPMEGANRPGHFAGVAQVVYRLLDIVRPDNLYMGQKDFQQFSIVQRMLELAKLNIQIVMVPTVREPDGLAKSSRNVRLIPDHRELAPRIYQVLQDAKKKVHSYFPAVIEKEAMAALQSVDAFKPEYFDVVEGRTLQPFDVFEDVQYAVACTAVWVGDVRLIDNIILKWPEK